MAIHIFEKLTNFLMPVDNSAPPQEKKRKPWHKRESKPQEPSAEHKPYLKLHSSENASHLKISIESPTCFDDVQKYANSLKSNVVVLINFQQVDSATQQKISDFLNGVCYILGGCVQRISEQAVIYSSANVVFDRQFFSYCAPAYSRTTTDDFAQ